MSLALKEERETSQVKVKLTLYDSFKHLSNYEHVYMQHPVESDLKVKAVKETKTM